jgi:hypothetical protein
MQYACAILSSVACLALRHFSTLFRNRNDFRNKLFEIKYAFWYSPKLLSETFLILRGADRDIINIYTGLHVKCSLLLSNCNKIELSRRISNNIQTSNFIRILPVVAELFHVAGETDGHNEANSRFSQVWGCAYKQPEINIMSADNIWNYA